jgi:hypothetical protein
MDGSIVPATSTASGDSGAWRTALIADEAHRSHGKQRTRYLHNALTGRSAQSAPLVYISFTSTPTASALEMFGTPSGDTLRPFHCYSMQQAIDDGVILDPLMNFQSVPIFGRAAPASSDESASRPESAFPTEPGETLDDEEEEAPEQNNSTAHLHALSSYDTGMAVRSLVTALNASRELVMQKGHWMVVSAPPQRACVELILPGSLHRRPESRTQRWHACGQVHGTRLTCLSALHAVLISTSGRSSLQGARIVVQEGHRTAAGQRYA